MTECTITIVFLCFTVWLCHKHMQTVSGLRRDLRDANDSLLRHAGVPVTREEKQQQTFSKPAKSWYGPFVTDDKENSN